MAVVMVIEDEMGIARLLADVLKDEGHAVLSASNGRQALEMASRDRPDLILTDYMMPVMDGADLIHALRADPALAAIPVMVMSSVPEPTFADRADGYAAFMRKPFKIYDLVDRVAEILNS